MIVARHLCHAGGGGGSVASSLIACDCVLRVMRGHMLPVDEACCIV